MDSKNEPLVPVGTKKKVVKNEIKEEIKLWPPPPPVPTPLGQMLAKNIQQWPYLAKANPILALLRSSQIFGLLRPNPPGPLLDLPTILLLQNNLLNMLNNGNRQVGLFLLLWVIV